MSNRPTLTVLVGSAGFASSALAHPPNLHFRGVGDISGGAFVSRAFDVEYHPQGGAGPSGLTVVGDSEGAGGARAFRWTPSAGIEDLGVLEPGHTFSTASDVSYWSGAIVVGSSGTSPSSTRAFFWTLGQGMSAVGPLAGGGTPLTAHAQQEDDSSRCFGQAATTAGVLVAYTGGTSGSSPLGSLGGTPEESAALGVSWNGSRIVGYSRDASGNIQAFYRLPSGTMLGLGFLNSTGPRESRARAINYWGHATIGESTSPNGPMEAFLDVGLGMFGLGDLPGGEFKSAALAVNRGDGPPGTSALVVVGWSEAADGERAFVWTDAAGIRDLKTVLEGEGYSLAGWTLQRATGISAKGKAIAGIGINPLGQTEGWVAYASCYHDCNGDLQKTVADFGCFQTRFVQGHPYADCDQSGGLTIADFGCFQTAFVGTLSCNEN